MISNRRSPLCSGWDADPHARDVIQPGQLSWWSMTRQVLVIEDDEDIAKLIELQLLELSCKVKLASDGVEGLAEAQSKRYDLLILDLMLPGMGGLEICQRIRGQDRYTPVLMLTSKSSELDRVLGLEMGADDYLTKPFSVLELAARVKAIFRRVDSLSKDKDSATVAIKVRRPAHRRREALSAP